MYVADGGEWDRIVNPIDAEFFTCLLVGYA
jgi:hypothetical protein